MDRSITALSYGKGELPEDVVGATKRRRVGYGGPKSILEE